MMQSQKKMPTGWPVGILIINSNVAAEERTLAGDRCNTSGFADVKRLTA
jgi:hypothetical protein